MDHRRFLLVYCLVVPAAILAGHVLVGGPAVPAVAIAAILVLAARFDNHTGSCLLVTIVLLVAIGILLSLLMLTARIAVH